MKLPRIAAATALAASLAYPVTATVGPSTSQAAAATPDLVCNAPIDWLDMDTGPEWVNDGLPGDNTGNFEAVPAEQPGTGFIPDYLEICYEPLQNVYFLKWLIPGNNPNANWMYVKWVAGLDGQKLGPDMGYNVSELCAGYGGFCPLVEGNGPTTGANEEWREYCYPGFPGIVSFFNYETGMYMSAQPNTYYQNPSAPLLMQSGRAYEAAGAYNVITKYKITSECPGG